jgi:arsenate reductase
MVKAPPAKFVLVEEILMKENDQPYKVLFLCTGNSARSVFGEYFLRRVGGTRFQSYSAGVDPVGRVNPFTIQVLRDIYRIDASEARSKDCEEMKGIEFDFVITVCDKARETCPVWPGQPIVAHWGVPDPAEALGSDEEKLRAFKLAAQVLYQRVSLLSALPLEKLDRLKLRKLVQDIGGSSTAAHVG